MTRTSYMASICLYFNDNKNQLNNLFLMTMVTTTVVYNRAFKHLQLLHVRWFDEHVNINRFG